MKPCIDSLLFSLEVPTQINKYDGAVFKTKCSLDEVWVKYQVIFDTHTAAYLLKSSVFPLFSAYTMSEKKAKTLQVTRRLLPI